MLDELPVFAVTARIPLPLDMLGAVAVLLAQLIEQWPVARPDGIKLVDAPARRLDQLLPSAGFLVMHLAVRTQLHCADEARQRQALTDQGEDDDGERDHDD